MGQDNVIQASGNGALSSSQIQKSRRSLIWRDSRFKDVVPSAPGKEFQVYEHAELAIDLSV
jgi:hypothetical protein